jgi:hypothetical protein
MEKNNDNMVRLRYLNILVIIEDEGKKNYMYILYDKNNKI